MILAWMIVAARMAAAGPTPLTVTAFLEGASVPLAERSGRAIFTPGTCRPAARVE